MEYSINYFKGHYCVFEDNEPIIHCESYKEAEEELETLKESEREYPFTVHYAILEKHDEWVFTHLEVMAKNYSDAEEKVRKIEKGKIIRFDV